MAGKKIIHGQFGSASIAVKIIDQGLFIGKIVPAYIHHRLMQSDRLDYRAVSRFGHDEVNGCQHRFEGKGKGFGQRTRVRPGGTGPPTIKRNGAIESSLSKGSVSS